MKKSFIRLLSITLACLTGVGTLTGVSLLQKNEAETVQAANDDFDGNQIHFWTVNNTSGSSSGIWSWGGSIKKGYQDSKIQVNGNSTFTFTVSEANMTSNFVTSYKFNIKVHNNMTVTVKRGSTQLFSQTATANDTWINQSKSFNSCTGSGNFTFSITNNNSSTSDWIYFESPNLTLYASIQYPVYITKGTGVSNVYLSTSSTATSGSASGTKFDNGKTVYGFATLANGYSAPSGWTNVSGSTYRVGSKYVSDGSADFGTLNATAVKYNITYNLNGGTVSGTNPTQYYVTSNAITLINPTKTGYTFTGWSGTGISGTSTSVTIAKGSTGDRSYTANWSANTYTVSYDGNKPSNATGYVMNLPAYATWTYDSDATLGSAPSLTGWTFGGWYKEAACTNLLGNAGQKLTKPNLTSTKGATVKLYAKWTAITYKVTYNGNKPAGAPEGSEVSNVPSDANLTYDSTTSYTFGAAPTFIDGYKFVGWYKEAEGITKVADASEVKSKPNLTTTNNATVTLYAKWVFEESIQQVVDLIDAIGVVSYPDSKQDIISAEDAYSALSAEYKNILESEGYTQVLTDSRDEYDTQRADAKSAVINAIDAIGEVSYPASKGLIETAENLYDALDADDKNATFIPNQDVRVEAREEYEEQRADAREAVITAINNIGDISYPGSEERLLYAEGLYNALADSDKNSTFVTNKDVKDEARDAYDGLRSYAISDVIAAIDYIGEVSYPASKALIEQAEALYNALAESDKNNTAIPNLDVLLDAREEYEDQRADAKTAVINAIDAIGEVTYPASKGAIEQAEALYNALDVTDQNADFIPNQDVKVEARAEYEEQRADARARVIAAIDNIGEVTYPSSQAKLEYAESLYDALDNSDKNDTFVTNKDVKDEARNEYDVLREQAVDFVIAAINDIQQPFNEEREGQIALADLLFDALGEDEKNDTWVTNLARLENAHAADDVADMIEALGAAEDTDAWREKVAAAREAYDALSGEQKLFIGDDLMDILLDREAAINVMDLINNIGETRYTPESKALIDTAQSAYDTFVNAGNDPELIANYQKLVDANTDYNNVQTFIDKVNAITNNPFEYSSECKALIDEARDYYQNTLDEDQKNIVALDASSYYQLLVNYENAYHAMKLIDDIGDMENSDACKQRIEEARAAVDALNVETEYPLMNEDLLKELADKEAAWAVIEEINALYPLTYGEEQEQAIIDARNSYNELKADQQPLVINLDMLTKAEEDYASVKAVVEQVDNLGDIRYDEESDKKIKDAREKYEALSEDQKKFYPADSLKVIVNYETSYEALDKIYHIGDVSYNTESEDLINEAREFYDSLSDEQKALIHIDDLKVLTASEETYAAQQKTAKIWNIVLFVLVGILLSGGLILLIILINKVRKNKNNGSNKPVKMMSVIGLVPVLIFTSHYFDAPYIILFVVAGLTILVWLANIVLFIVVLATKKKAVEQKSDETEDEEVVTVTDEAGNKFQIRYIKSFMAKLIQSDDETKKYYEELKNEALSYKDVTDRLSWHYDSINFGREQVLKFGVRGKTLCVYYPLNIEEVDQNKYKVEKIESKKYEKVPCMYRIKNDRRLNYAKVLIARVMRKLHIEKGEEKHEVYANLPYEENKPLIERGLIKELKVALNKNGQREVVESKVNADGDEILVTKDEQGNVFEIRFVKSFTAKLSQAEDETKEYYNILKNYVLSYKDVHSRVSWHYDAINVGRDYVMKFAIRGKTLCVYFALDASKLDEKYKVEEAKGKKFEDVPVLYRIKNDRRLGYAKELIDMLMAEKGIQKGKELTDEYRIPYESTKALLAKGLIKETKTKVVDKKVE